MASERELAAYLRHRIENWLREDPARTAAELAKLADVTPTHISTIRSESRGIGMKSLRGLASALGTTLADLEAGAVEWGKTNPSPTPAFRVERYEARLKAIERAREVGLSDRAIQAVATMEGKDADRLPTDAWFQMIREFEHAFAAGKLGQPVSPAATAPVKRPKS